MKIKKNYKVSVDNSLNQRLSSVICRDVHVWGHQILISYLSLIVVADLHSQHKIGILKVTICSYLLLKAHLLQSARIVWRECVCSHVCVSMLLCYNIHC